MKVLVDTNVLVRRLIVVHDVRPAESMNTHGIVAFSVLEFTRFPGVEVVAPDTVV